VTPEATAVTVKMGPEAVVEAELVSWELEQAEQASI